MWNTEHEASEKARELRANQTYFIRLLHLLFLFVFYKLAYRLSAINELLCPAAASSVLGCALSLFVGGAVVCSGI